MLLPFLLRGEREEKRTGFPYVKASALLLPPQEPWKAAVFRLQARAGGPASKWGRLQVLRARSKKLKRSLASPHSAEAEGCGTVCPR